MLFYTQDVHQTFLQNLLQKFLYQIFAQRHLQFFQKLDAKNHKANEKLKREKFLRGKSGCFLAFRTVERFLTSTRPFTTLPLVLVVVVASFEAPPLALQYPCQALVEAVAFAFVAPDRQPLSVQSESFPTP